MQLTRSHDVIILLPLKNSPKMQETGWEPSPLFRNMSKEMVRVVRLHRPRFEINAVMFAVLIFRSRRL